MNSGIPDSEQPEPPADASSQTGGTQSHRPKVLAFYLPQFHPIPENDQWWEPGFTEWNNVVRAKPLFPGHYQPHLPGELGFYDLRVPEVREQQAALARQYGIHGFVYYHYWFHGRRLLERPFDEVLSSGHPDFPFALCWANEEWTRNWDALSGNVLVEQRFSPADDLAHIQWLIRAFADDRYIKIDGRPLLLVYRSDLLPDAKRTTELWREESQAAGFPDVYLAMVESRHKDDDPRPLGFDASVGFASNIAKRLSGPVDAYRENLIVDYEAAPEAALHRPETPWKRFPGVMVGWDNSPRRKSEATIYSGGTPEAYGRWLRRTIESVSDVRDEENLIFITAWNEWAEGNHLEPDRRYGRGYLEVTRQALDGRTAAGAAPDASVAEPVGLDPDSAAGHVFRTVCEVITSPRKAVEIGPGTPGLASAFEDAGIEYQLVTTETDDDGAAALLQRLDDQGDLGALLLGDVLEQCPDPHRLLAALSNWACDHGNPPLVVSIANVGHFDVGFLLLCGQWDPPDEDRLGTSAVRYFTRERLERLFQRCGWNVANTDNHESIFSPRHPATLVDQLPEAMAGALAVLAQSSNPDWAVEHFVWSLVPVGVEEAPASYADAIARPPETTVAELPADVSRTVSDYLTSIGLLAGKDQWRVEDRLRRSRLQILRKQIQQALVELVLGDQWADKLPLLSDTVDELADIYLARSDLASAFDDDGRFDAKRYVIWAIDDQPMLAAAATRLGEEPRREAAQAIRAQLSTSEVDREHIEEATDALVDFYMHRRDLHESLGDGTTVDAVRLLSWVLSGDDQSIDRLSPFRALIESAVSKHYEQPRRQAAQAIRAALSLSEANRDEIEAATDALVDFYIYRPNLHDSLGDGITVDAVRLLSWVLTQDDPSVDRLAPYRALIESALSRHYEQPRREAAQAIRAALSLSQVDREHIEAATDALVDFYIYRPNLHDSLGDGTTVDAIHLLSWVLAQDDPSVDRLAPYRALIESAVSKHYEQPRREAAQAIRAALSLSEADRDEIEAATDALVDFYIYRPNLHDSLGDGTTVDAIHLLSWVLAQDDASVDRLAPYRALIESAVSKHYEQPRREAAQAIRAALSLSEADRDEIEAATDALVDFYIYRPDLHDSLGDGTTVDAIRFLSWVLSHDDQSVDQLSPYRVLIESATSRHYEQPKREAAQAIRAALSLSQVDREHIEAATDALVDLYIYRPDLQESLGDGTTVDATRFLSWVVPQIDQSADRLAPYRALIESAVSSLSASPSE